jgi:putative salt-induced outer membrane protein YdiY
MRPPYLAFIVILYAFASTAAADELKLNNGDRITCTVHKLDAGKLTVKTEYGELLVNWADVAEIRMDQPLMISVANADTRLGRLSSTAAGQVMITSEGQTPVTVPMADIIGVAPVAPAWILSGGANAGFFNTGGNTDVRNLRLDGELVARASASRYTAGASINRGSDRGRITARNATAAFRYDRFLTTRLFLNANSIFTNDRFRDLDLRTAIGAGVGYQAWDTPVLKLSVDGGLGYVRQNFSSTPDNNYAALQEAVKAQWFLAATRVEIFHQHSGYFGVTGDDNLFMRLQNGLRFALIGGLVTTAQLDIDYDRNPAPGRQSTDRAFALTFGYRF